MLVFTFAVLIQKYSFWVNVVQKIKIVSLSLNLVSHIHNILRLFDG